MFSFSLCMIVKNEEKVLRRCLDSLEGLFDEIIIVDTGSEDSTKEIAQEYTDKVYDFAWINDFSAARNFAFSKCSCDYIYSADADEILDTYNRQRFLELKKCLVPEVEIVQMWYLNTDEYGTTENYSKELRPKLYKRLRQFVWIEPVHEAVNLVPVVFDSDIEIIHAPLGDHSGRDFKVFKNAIANGKQLSSKLFGMYSRELAIAGKDEDFYDAEEYFLENVFDGNRSEEERQYCFVILAHVYRLKNEDAEFFKWALKAVVSSPCSEVCIELAKYYYDHEDYNEAIVWYMNAANETEAILDVRAKTVNAYNGLADCYKKLADLYEDSYDSFMEESNNYKKLAENCELL